MDLGQLRYFTKIVEHKSFTRAAQDCSVSQPALSQQIAKLEKELDQPLFERQGRTIQLTATGHLLNDKAEKILQLVDDTLRQITDDGETGRICLSAIPTVGPYYLPHILKVVGDQFAKAQFIVSEWVTDDLLKKCSSGDIDVGLVALPAASKQLSVEPLFEEELLLAIPANHRLAQQPEIRLTDIDKEPFVLLSEDHCLAESIEAFCNRQSFQPVSTASIQQLTTIQHLVALGQGVSFIPKMATQTDLGGQIVYRSLAGEAPTRTIAMCWNPYRYQSQLVGCFIKGVRELGDPKLLADMLPLPQPIRTIKKRKPVAKKPAR